MAIQRKPSLIRQREQRRQDIKAFNKGVSQLNREIESLNYGGSVQEFNKLYNDIKAQNPAAARRLKYNPQTIQNEINQRKTQLNDLLKKSKKREDRADDKGDKVKEKGEKAYQDGIREGLKELSKGNLLTVKDITNYANTLERQAERNEKLRDFNTKVDLKTVKDNSLYVSRTPIGGGKKEYLVNGQWVDTKPTTKTLPNTQSKNVAYDNNKARIEIIDTAKNIKTVSEVNLRTGKTLKTEKIKLTPQQKKQNAEEILAQRTQNALASEIFTNNFVNDFNNLPKPAQESAIDLNNAVKNLQNNNVISPRDLSNSKLVVNEKTIDKWSKLNKELEPGAYKAVVGLGVFGLQIGESGADLIRGLGQLITGQVSVKEVVNGFKDSPNQFRNTLQGISKGDPKAMGKAVFELTLIKGFNVPRIDKIELPKFKERLQNFQQNLEIEKRIAQDVQRVSPPQDKVKVNQRIKEIDTQLKDLKTGNLNAKSFKGGNSSKNIANFQKRLAKRNEDTIKRYFTAETGVKVKELKLLTKNADIIKASPKQITDTANALFRGKNTKAFTNYKKKVKKLRGDNLVRKNNNFVLEEPKENLRKGKKTGKKADKKKETVKEIKIDTPNKDLSVAQLDKLEKQIAKEVTQFRKGKSKLNKKGSAQLLRSSKKYYNNNKKQTSKLKNDLKDLQRYTNEVFKEFQRKRKNKTLKQQKELSKDLQKKYLSRKQKLKQKLDNLTKKNNKLKAITINLKELDKSKATSYSNLNKQLNALNNDLKKVNNDLNKSDLKPLKPVKPTTPKKTPGSKTPTLRKPTGGKPKIKAPKINRTKGLRVVKPKKIKFKPDFNKAPPKGLNYKVEGFISVGKRKLKVVSGLPPNKAFNKVFSKGTKKYRGVDNSTAQSFEFRIVGLTKAKDDKAKKGFNKVTKSKQSTKTVLKLKEKSKARIDTKGEKKGLKARRNTTKKKKR